ncbi:MAG: hypothetical protein II152_03225, partial [Succinivibrionaceae bacterium]|nr:hypothetical protein [Succinivibrionaceae bacterium]
MNILLQAETHPSLENLCRKDAAAVVPDDMKKYGTKRTERFRKACRDKRLAALPRIRYTLTAANTPRGRKSRLTSCLCQRFKKRKALSICPGALEMAEQTGIEPVT